MQYDNLPYDIQEQSGHLLLYIVKDKQGWANQVMKQSGLWARPIEPHTFQLRGVALEMQTVRLMRRLRDDYGIRAKLQLSSLGVSSCAIFYSTEPVMPARDAS